MGASRMACCWDWSDSGERLMVGHEWGGRSAAGRCRGSLAARMGRRWERHPWRRYHGSGRHRWCRCSHRQRLGCEGTWESGDGLRTPLMNNLGNGKGKETMNSPGRIRFSEGNI
ncbi:hypothetical protein CRG98_037407 [Punica granatum]|uniref:Uncharacterized protein n=1 Tax=Punica granatum TaxID=22663 RepID=A0A2I0IDZ9_PUNGR|nr:hypothetical protein CRG98_037407 [Punica granatum]